MKRNILVLVVSLLVVLISQKGLCISLEKRWTTEEKILYWQINSALDKLGIVNDEEYLIYDQNGNVILRGHNIWGATRLTLGDHMFGLLDKNYSWHFFSYQGELLWSSEPLFWPYISSKYVLLFEDDSEAIKICNMEGIVLQDVFSEKVADFIHNDEYIALDQGIFKIEEGELTKIIDIVEDYELAQVIALSDTNTFLVKYRSMYSNKHQLHKYDFAGQLLWKRTYEENILVNTFNQFYSIITNEQTQLNIFLNDDTSLLELTFDGMKFLNSVKLSYGFFVVRTYETKNSLFLYWVDQNGEINKQLKIYDAISIIDDAGKQLFVAPRASITGDVEKTTFAFYTITEE